MQFFREDFRGSEINHRQYLSFRTGPFVFACRTNAFAYRNDKSVYAREAFNRL